MNNTTDTPTETDTFESLVGLAYDDYFEVSREARRAHNDFIEEFVEGHVKGFTRAELLELTGPGFTDCTKDKLARILAGRAVDEDATVDKAYAASNRAFRYLRLLRLISAADVPDLKDQIIKEFTS